MTESSAQESLRICHILSGDLWAGAEVMAYQLLTGLARLPGIELRVILLNKGRLAEELAKAGVSTCVYDEQERSFLGITTLVAQSVREWAPQVLHAHRYKENALAYLVSLALNENAVLISTQHGMPEFYGGRVGLLRRLKLHLNNWLLDSRFDKTIAVSGDIRQALIRDFGFQARHVNTILNGIVIPEMQNRTVDRRPLVIGSAGRFVPVKDYPLMVAVAKEVMARHPDVRFEFAGDGPLLGLIEGLVGSHGREGRIVLKGFVSDVNAFYAGLDLFLNTSLHEGIPMSVLEAMARGIPAVVPRVGGLAEIIDDGKDGYLVDTRDPLDFAKRCVALCNDAPGRMAMARAAREKVVRKFSVDRMVKDYLGMYTSVLEGLVKGRR